MGFMSDDERRGDWDGVAIAMEKGIKGEQERKSKEWDSRSQAYNEMLDQKHPYMSLVAKHLDLSDDDPDYSCKTNNDGQSRSKDIGAIINTNPFIKVGGHYQLNRTILRERMTEYNATLGRTLENVRR